MNLSKTLLILSLFSCFCFQKLNGQNQFYISNNDAVSAKPGTTITIEGLVLIPSSDFIYSGERTIQRTNTVLNPHPAVSIQRAIGINNGGLLFSGSLGIRFKDSELNNLTKDSLVISIYDGNSWTNHSNVTRTDNGNLVMVDSLSEINIVEVTLTSASITPVLTLTSNTFCAADINNYSLSATPAGGSWTGNGIIANADGTYSFRPSTAGMGTHTLTYTLPGQTPATLNASVASSPNLYSVTGGGSFCEGSGGVSIGLNGSDANTNYTLMQNGVPVVTLSGTGLPISFGNFSIADNYTVEAITGNCKLAMQGNATISINPAVTASVTSGGPTTFCSPGSVTLTASAASSYLWSNGETTQSITVTSSGTYSVTETNGFGCTATSSPVSVTVNPTPVFSASLPTVFCSNDNNAYSVISEVPGTSILNGSGLELNNGNLTFVPSLVSTSANTLITITYPGGCSASFDYDLAPPPSIVGTPSNIIRNVDAGTCGALVTYSSPTLSNNCGGSLTLTSGLPSGSVFPVGVTIVTYTLTRADGSMEASSFTVTVIDNLPPAISCTEDQMLCINSAGHYNIPALSTIDNCGIQSISYSISGATTRIGNGINASGNFNPGSSLIKWTVVDDNGNVSICEINVLINQALTASIPDAFTLPSGVAPNTVYLGYVPAQDLTLTVIPASGMAPFSYLWNTGATTSSITVMPGTQTTYSVSITDAMGCMLTTTKLVQVVDVRCSNKNEKVMVCKPTGNGDEIMICVSPNAVPAQLEIGGNLGSCEAAGVMLVKENVNAIPLETKMEMFAYPNPSSGVFRLNIRLDSPEKAELVVFDILGKMKERKLVNTGLIEIGQDYRPGVYLVELRQGATRVVVKLIKGSN